MEVTLLRVMENYEIYLKRIEKAQKREKFWRYLPFPLFFATLLTTFFAGALMRYVHPMSIFKNPALLLEGASFAIPLMVILLTHEMGHYLTSKVHRVKATLPYFIPFPNYIGTFGAVIKMKSPMRDSRSLIDIGAAGPLAGFVLSIVAAVYGLSHAQAVPLDTLPADSLWSPRIFFGPNIAFVALMNWFGPVEQFREGYVIVNPVMYAAWLGLFVTSLNLMPAGQLDGGHIAYAILGEKWARRTAKVVVGVLIMAGLPGFIMSFVPLNLPVFPIWPGYMVWGILILVIGLGHPPPLNPAVKLDPPRKIVGLVCLGIWIVTFTPVPFGML